jgi:hypothetical protein
MITICSESGSASPSFLYRYSNPRRLPSKPATSCTEAGFRDAETGIEKHTFVLSSFDAYYGPFERGGASTGQALISLPERIRRAIREEMRRSLGDDGGPINIEVELRIASCPKWFCQRSRQQV